MSGITETNTCNPLITHGILHAQQHLQISKISVGSILSTNTSYVLDDSKMKQLSLCLTICIYTMLAFLHFTLTATNVTAFQGNQSSNFITIQYVQKHNDLAQSGITEINLIL